jgi:hypothetical protein
VEIIANYIQLLGGGNSGGDSRSGGSQQSSKPPTQTYSRENDDGFTDDIPF